VDRASGPASVVLRGYGPPSRAPPRTLPGGRSQTGCPRARWSPRRQPPQRLPPPWHSCRPAPGDPALAARQLPSRSGPAARGRARPMTGGTVPPGYPAGQHPKQRHPDEKDATARGRYVPGHQPGPRRKQTTHARRSLDPPGAPAAGRRPALATIHDHHPVPASQITSRQASTIHGDNEQDRRTIWPVQTSPFRM